LKEEALDRTMWRARFGRGFGPVVRQTTKWMNTGWSKSLCAPGYYNTIVRCTETFWSHCITWKGY